MAGTGLNMGWSGVTVLPTPGTLIVIDNVTELDPGRMGTAKKFYGDVSPFPKLIATRQKSRTLTITSGDVAKIMAIPDDVPCVVTAIFNDPLNGATIGGGALQYTLTNAVLMKSSAKGATQEFGLATVEFEAYGVAGGDPLTVVAL